jgi:methionine biosynthesis protein MetW
MVLVVDPDDKPLAPCGRKKAESLVARGLAAVVSVKPLTIQLAEGSWARAWPKADPAFYDGKLLQEFRRARALHRSLGLGDGAGISPVPRGVAEGVYRWQDGVILAEVPLGSSVLDLGCGAGQLLDKLRTERGVVGQGVELDPAEALAAMDRGVPVLNLDLSEVLGDFRDLSFDYVILEHTLQTLQRPLEVLHEMLRVGARGIVSFPNFGHWRVRLDLAARGRMPVTPGLPYSWHDTPNIHLFTIDDFWDICALHGVRIRKAFGRSGGEIKKLRPRENFVTEEAILFLEKRKDADSYGR